MGILKNLGLLILLALFAGGGYLVRDAFIKFDQLEAYKNTPELATLPEAVQIRLNAQEEEIKMLTKKNEKGEKNTTDEIEMLQEKIEGLEADNAKYFEELTLCEADAEATASEEATEGATETEVGTTEVVVPAEVETTDETADVSVKAETGTPETNKIISPSLESVLEEIEKAKQATQN